MSDRGEFLYLPKPALGAAYDDRSTSFNPSSDMDFVKYLDLRLLSLLYLRLDMSGTASATSGSNLNAAGVSVDGSRALIAHAYDDGTNYVYMVGEPTSQNYSWWYVISDTTTDVSYGGETDLYVAVTDGYVAFGSQGGSIYIFASGDTSPSITTSDSYTISSYYHLNLYKISDQYVALQMGTDVEIWDMWNLPASPTATLTINDTVPGYIAVDGNGTIAYVNTNGELEYALESESFGTLHNTTVPSGNGVAFDGATGYWVIQPSNGYLRFSKDLNSWPASVNVGTSATIYQLTAFAGIVKDGSSEAFTLVDYWANAAKPMTVGMAPGFIAENGIVYQDNGTTVQLSNGVPELVTGAYSSGF